MIILAFNLEHFRPKKFKFEGSASQFTLIDGISTLFKFQTREFWPFNAKFSLNRIKNCVPFCFPDLRQSNFKLNKKCY